MVIKLSVSIGIERLICVLVTLCQCLALVARCLRTSRHVFGGLAGEIHRSISCALVTRHGQCLALTAFRGLWFLFFNCPPPRTLFSDKKVSASVAPEDVGVAVAVARIVVLLFRVVFAWNLVFALLCSLSGGHCCLLLSLYFLSCCQFAPPASPQPRGLEDLEFDACRDKLLHVWTVRAVVDESVHCHLIVAVWVENVINAHRHSGHPRVRRRLQTEDKVPLGFLHLLLFLPLELAVRIHLGKLPQLLRACNHPVHIRFLAHNPATFDDPGHDILAVENKAPEA